MCADKSPLVISCPLKATGQLRQGNGVSTLHRVQGCRHQASPLVPQEVSGQAFLDAKLEKQRHDEDNTSLVLASPSQKE